MFSEREGANVDLVLFIVNDDIAVDILNSLKFFEAILVLFLLHNWSTIVHCCVCISKFTRSTNIFTKTRKARIPMQFAVHLATVTSSSANNLLKINYRKLSRKLSLAYLLEVWFYMKGPSKVEAEL